MLFSREEEKVTIPAESGTNDEFEIGRILDERKRHRQKEYLIKWKRHTSEENSWVPEYVMSQPLIHTFVFWCWRESFMCIRTG